MFKWLQRKRKDPVRGRVVVLLDYENIYRGAREAGKIVPIEGLKEIGRKYGIADTVQIFLSHFTPPGLIMELGRQAVDLHVCPPIKFGGPDTVDRKIHAECLRFVDHPQVQTFIIVSTDGDFRETEDLLLNHGKRVIRFVLDGLARILVSKDGETIELPSYHPNTSGEGPMGLQNVFIDIIQRFKKGESVDSYDEEQMQFLRLIIETLAKISRAGYLMNGDRRSFAQMHTLVWDFIQPRARRFSKGDCHAALHALINYTDVLESQTQTVSPQKYYTYNQTHTLAI